MTRLDNDSNALRLKCFREGSADLLCEPFLDLKSPGVHFDYPRDLGKANHLVVGNVSNMHLVLLASDREMGN